MFRSFGLLLCVLALSGCGSDSAFEKLGSQRDNYFFSVKKEAMGDMPRVETFAKGFCEKKSFCAISFWEEGGARPAGLPLTQREADSIIATYRMNKGNRSEVMMWHCEKFPGSTPKNCFM